MAILKKIKWKNNLKLEGRFIMCGIVGYVGKRQASDLLVEGL